MKADSIPSPKLIYYVTHNEYIDHKNRERQQIIKLDVLFFGAHPDDVELNCGGTLISLVSCGKRAGIADLTRGELSTRGTLQTRGAETKLATEMLGIAFRKNLLLKDGGIRNDEASLKKIITVLRSTRPEIVFAPYPFDRHPDHIHSGNLIREAVFYSGLSKIRTERLAPHRPERTFFYRSALEIPVSFVFDISRTFAKKLDVLKCYRTQFYDPDSDLPQTFISSKLFEHEIESRARHFGFRIGAEFGEPFFCYDLLRADEKNLFSI